LLIPQGGSREPQAASSNEPTHLPLEIIPGSAPPGTVLETFTNTWDTNAIGLVYNPTLDLVRYAHQSYTTASIWDIAFPTPHNPLDNILLSAVNPGWPISLNQYNGIGYDFLQDTYFLPNYEGDSINADDYIIEIMPDGTILDAWEMDDDLGSNDSYDGTSIDVIGDIAVVPGTPPRYFVAAAEGTSTVYEIDLIKTGTFWTPDTWGTIVTCTVPGLADNRSIDYDAEHGLLYHSDSLSTNIVATDLDCNVVITTTCESPSGINTGVTYVEGKNEPEIWVTDYNSNATTRCAATGGPPCDQSATAFYEDFEGNLSNWEMTGLWNVEHETDTCGALVDPFPSPDTDLYFGLDSTCTFSTGVQVTGTLALTTDVDLTYYRYASLNFWSYEDTECTGSLCNYDKRYVDISTDGGTTWATIWASIGPESSWYQAYANLANYVGGPVRLRFRFDSVDEEWNGYFGWMVDNVEIVGCPEPVRLTFSVNAPEFCGAVVNQAVLTDPQAATVTLQATTQVVEDLYQAWEFENDDGGFIRTVPGEWEWGVPTYPAGLRAHNGSKLWGTDLHGDANSTISEHRLARSVTLPTQPNGIYLDWWDWSKLNYGACAQVYVEGVQVYQRCDYEQDWWVRHLIDVTDWAGLTVDIEFVLYTDGKNNTNWFIDDISIHSGCVTNAQVSPPSLSAQAYVNTTKTVGLSICNTENLPLDWSLSERTASTLQLNLAPIGPTRLPTEGSSITAPADYTASLSNSSLPDFNPQAGMVAIFKDADPWHMTETEDILVANSIPYQVLTRTALVTLDLSSFGMIVFSGDQPQTFYNAYAANKTRLEDYVEQGGFLNFFAADTGWNGGHLTATLPGGLSWVSYFTNTNEIDDPAHPVVQGVPDPFYGEYASHGYFTSLPAGAHIIASAPGTGKPTIVEYPLGAGRVIAFGQPLEIAHGWGWPAGPILENTLLWGYGYTLPSRVPWLSETPLSGSVPPGMCTQVTVAMNATGLSEGEYTAGLVFWSNDPDTTRLVLPVTFDVMWYRLYLPLVRKGP
jgi:hypothetical protein